ncbi:MAG: aminoacetone oxidase family FAD-binding enzyme [Treponema sp.]|nr:MAG: aminoacetone oxidase family FAD-binding enzyme [Treponema sp.]
MQKKIIIVGGGASGYFTAINAKELNPELDIIILEQSNNVLQKVKISGGGRCNLTHACFDAKELIQFYPRGAKELLGAFNTFMTFDTIEWFEKRGVPLKIESDGRVFPKANKSDAIIDCFEKAINELGIKVLKNYKVLSFFPSNGSWIIKTNQKIFEANKLVIASGNSKTIWESASRIGCNIIKPVPSLFTFNIQDKRLTGLSGVTVPCATVKINDTKLESMGALLITHWGMSGPAILKLSSFAARVLAEKNYRYDITVNWVSKNIDEVLTTLLNFKKTHARKRIVLKSPFLEISKRHWKRLLHTSNITEIQNWADISSTQMQNLSTELTKSIYHASGRSCFKDEFVTAGGVDLKEINCKTFESKIHKNIFFVGETLNIDGVTGGFNFQNAWTTAFICAKALS